MAVPEAPLRATRFGLVADGEGWFVVNAAELRWRDFGPLGVGCDFEGKRAGDDPARRGVPAVSPPRPLRLPAGLAAAAL